MYACHLQSDFHSSRSVVRVVNSRRPAFANRCKQLFTKLKSRSCAFSGSITWLYRPAAYANAVTIIAMPNALRPPARARIKERCERVTVRTVHHKFVAMFRVNDRQPVSLPVLREWPSNHFLCSFFHVLEALKKSGVERLEALGHLNNRA